MSVHLTFSPEKLRKLSIPLATSWLLADCTEAKGQQELWIRQKPELLTALRQQAIVQSVESSNRIEGVTVSAKRLRPLVLGKAKPQDRSEEEVSGYRRALSWIFTQKRLVTVTPEILLSLHKMSQGLSAGDGGAFKARDNEIIELLPRGGSRVRFVPTSAKETPAAITSLCHRYRLVSVDASIPPLLQIATVVFDFLCIHPFRDGNGRVSRLLTTLLLESEGYQVSRFVSLERLIESSRDDYYRVLEECSQGWQQGKNPIIPWWNYFLAIVRSAYREFKEKVEAVPMHSPKSALARALILDQPGEFTLAEVRSQLPSLSEQLVRKILSELRDAGKLKLEGRARGARWRVVH